MDVVNCSLRFRPVRIGWCLRQNDWTAYREILGLNFILAGGQFNPLIPIDDENYARALIRAFRVDVLLSVTEDVEILAFIEKFPYLTPPSPNRTFWDSFNGGRVPHFVDISHPIKKHFWQSHKNSPDYHLLCYDWQSDDPLANLFLTTYGKLPQPSLKEIDYASLLGKGVAVKSSSLTPQDSFPEIIRDLSTFAPRHFCRLGVNQHYSYSNHWEHNGFYIGSVENFQDMINFWNLMATDLSVVFYDPQHSNRLQKRQQDWLSLFQSKESISKAPSLAFFGQTIDILKEEVQWASTARVNFFTVDATSWSASNIKVPYMYFTEHQVTGLQSKLSSGKPIFSIRPSVHPFDEDVFLQGQQMVVSIQPRINQYNDHTTTLQLPFIPELNPFYDRACHSGVGLSCTRVEPDGIGFIKSINYYDLSLQPISVVELIDKLFGLYGMKACLSDAGLLTQRLINQMGGLQGCRIFKFKGVRDLVNGFTPFDSLTWGNATQTILGSKECFKQGEKIYLEGKKVSDPNNLFKILLQKNVFSAGLQFKCPNCLLNFWSSSNRLESDITCDHCQYTFNMLPHLHTSGTWRFRPSGLFITRDKQKGAIPTMLTLQLLELALGWGDTLYSAPIKFHKNGKEPFEGESDLVIVLPKPNQEGKIEIVLAECKSEGAANSETKSEGGKITDSDIEKIKTIANTLPSDQFCVYAVFSKLARFSPEELKRIAALNSQKIRVIIFTTEDLESLHPFEELLRKHNPSRFAGNLQTMATITSSLILSNCQLGYPEHKESPIGLI